MPFDPAATREVLRNFPLWMKITFYIISAIALAVFAYGCWLRVQKYRRGQPAGRWNQLGPRLLGAFGRVAAHTTVGKRHRRVGLAHFAIFWGYLTLTAGTITLAIDYDLFRGLLQTPGFWYGAFYQVYKLVMNLMGAALVVGLLYMIWRRGVARPKELDYTRPDRAAGAYDRSSYSLGDAFFVGLLVAAAVTGFLLQAVRIVADGRPVFETWTVVGWATSSGFATMGLTADTANAIHPGLWWAHVVLSLAFTAWIPFSKAVHMLVDAANLAFAEPSATRRLHPPRLPAPAPAPSRAGAATATGAGAALGAAMAGAAAAGPAGATIIGATGLAAAAGGAGTVQAAPPATAVPVYVGVERVEDLTWKQLLDLDACTKCGRCHVACPAQLSGAPLSPRDLILDLREYADTRYGVNRRFGFKGGLRAAGLPTENGHVRSLAGDVVLADTLWSCYTCMACVEACPVGIEHVPTIVDLRRRLVDRGEMPGSLQDALMKLGKNGNSFGASERQRGRWTTSLPFKVKDARKESVDFLWFVGDFASYNPRVQEATRAFARLLHQAGVDFGILYDGERNAGNDVRRIGEEGLFEALAEHNVQALAACEFNTIVTTDPHSLNVLKNEYPAHGAEHRVVHYTELLIQLLDEGRLQVANPVEGRATYHDPCYLGRYNGVYEAPRRALRAIGVDLVEMGRCRQTALCCGAGGGRIWMDDSLLKGERPSVQRIREAAAIGDVRHFVVTCPKDVTMYEDAIKAVPEASASGMRVRDLAELLELACRGEPASSVLTPAPAEGAAPPA